MTGSAFVWPELERETGKNRLVRDAVESSFSIDAPVEAVSSFAEFVQRRNASLLTYEHVPRLVSVGQRVASGELRRVLVIMPPRYFKSEVFSRLLAAYYLRHHGNRHVGLASYGAALAWELSEEARNYFEADGGGISADTSAKRRWRNEADGEMWADGVGGSLLGRGYHLGIVDDPIDPLKGLSPSGTRAFENWWPSKFLSRQEPNAAIVVVMQRLGTEDPIDYLFRREVGEDTDEAPEYWHVVVCDEKKSAEPLGRWVGSQGLPPTCTLEPDPRTEGEVLAPSRFDAQAVERMQRSAGPYISGAQRQQRPSTPTGDFWKGEWFGLDAEGKITSAQVYDELPFGAYNGGKDWDTAFTSDDANAASAWIESFRGPGPAESFPIYIHDCDWRWLEFPELVEWMRSVGGPHYIEEKASGKSASQTLRREKISASEVPVSGDKFTRAASVQPIVSNRRIHIRRSIVRHLLQGERQGLLRITAERLLAGKPDIDLNDAFVQAIIRHTGGRQRDLDPSSYPALKG